MFTFFINTREIHPVSIVYDGLDGTNHSTKMWGFIMNCFLLKWGFEFSK